MRKEKPSYEELEKRIADLELENLKLNQSELLSKEINKKLENHLVQKNIYENQLLLAKEQAEASEAQFRSLLDIAPEPIYIQYEQKFAFLNKAALNLYGAQSESELIGQPLIDRIHPDYIDIVRENIKNNIPVRNFQYKHLRLDKSVIEIELSVMPVKYQGLKGGLVFVKDITERKKAEEALKHSHDLMQYIIEHNRSSVAVHDRDLRYIYVSNRYLQEYNVKEKDIIGKHHYDVFPDLPQQWRDVHQKALSGVISSAEDDVFYRDDGSIEWTRWECRPWYESDGTIGGIIVYTEVITERKKIENEIKLRNQELESFFNCAIDLLCIANTEGRFIRLNKEWENVMGYSLQELENKNFLDLVHPEDYESTENTINQLFNQISIVNFTNRNRCKNGDYKWIEWNLFPNGNLIYTSGRDITEQRSFQETLIQKNMDLEASEEEIRATNEELLTTSNALIDINKELKLAKEKAEESDRLKSSFLANMSHEIRTPMNAIIGFSECLLTPGLTDERKQRFTKIIKERTYDLLRIVEDILDVSKIEVGQMKFIESEFDLSALMNDLFLEYHQKIEDSTVKSDIQLSLSLPEELKNIKIKNDSQRLKQVMTNLLDNAYKFTHKGSIRFGCKIEDESALTFFVEDSGIGIPDNKQEIIFDRFRQANDAITSHLYGGTGLGLAIVKGIVSLMKGIIWVESTMNVGSTFYFSIPFVQTAVESDNNNDSVSLINPWWSDKTVLVVEDDEYNREYLKEVLSDTGLHLLYASNGEQALQQFYSNPAINLVLMDIRLSDTNGLELTRKMKNEKPSLTIIAQTAYASPNDMEGCIEAGCSNYISKPIKPLKLLKLIDNYLKR